MSVHMQWRIRRVLGIFSTSCVLFPQGRASHQPWNEANSSEPQQPLPLVLGVTGTHEHTWLFAWVLRIHNQAHVCAAGIRLTCVQQVRIPESYSTALGLGFSEASEFFRSVFFHGVPLESRQSLLSVRLGTGSCLQQ